MTKQDWQKVIDIVEPLKCLKPTDQIDMDFDNDKT